MKFLVFKKNKQGLLFHKNVDKNRWLSILPADDNCLLVFPNQIVLKQEPCKWDLNKNLMRGYCAKRLRLKLPGKISASSPVNDSCWSMEIKIQHGSCIAVWRKFLNSTAIATSDLPAVTYLVVFFSFGQDKGNHKPQLDRRNELAKNVCCLPVLYP